jgi:hypothetical protein
MRDMLDHAAALIKPYAGPIEAGAARPKPLGNDLSDVERMASPKTWDSDRAFDFGLGDSHRTRKGQAGNDDGDFTALIS